MEYENNIDYNQKIQESIYKNSKKISKAKEKLKKLEHISRELRNIETYAVSGIMPCW